MTQTIAILGRQPALGLAELESLYGAESLRPITANTVLLNTPPETINAHRLGGTVKLAKLLAVIDTTDWRTIADHLAQTIPDHLQYLPEGKLRLGLNAYDLNVSVKELNRTGLELKKIIKQAGRSVRVVPNTSLELSSAQTLHNQLTGPTGWEFVLIRDGRTTLLGQVTHVQNINAYAARDQARPKRDARVGMLPPKLAQIIINLTNSGDGEIILDPFCGTGVVLQEALLMGYYVYGTDLEPRMIDYTRENLKWLIGPAEQNLTVGDATTLTWEIFDTIACETYLGRPFATEPAAAALEEVMRDVDTIHRKFLQNVARQTKPGFRMCIAIPTWFTRSGIKHLKTLASLEELGYTRMSFVHAANKDLIYHREGQIVGRELVVLTRK